MYCFLVFASVCLYAYYCAWVDADPSEEPQYQYPEQPSSDQFKQQQEQYEEGKYNMNNTYHFKYISMPHFNIVCL